MQTDEIENGLSRPHDLIIDDDEPIYDRLGEKGGVSKMPRSPTPQWRHDSGNFRRVKGTHKATRESVLNLADDLMERRMTGSKGDYDPQPMEHTVSEVDLKPSIQLTTSEQLPDRKPHQAAPLAPHHRRTGSRDLKKEGMKKPAIEVTSPITPKGNVSQKKLMFSFNPSSPSRIPPPSTRQGGNTPMKALASTSEMTKSAIPVKTESRAPSRNTGESSWASGVKMRSTNNKRTGGKVRPASFDVSLLLNNEKNVSGRSKDDSLPCDDIEVGMFNRNTQIRTAFRKRSQSREFSPESAEDTKAPKSMPATEPVPRSPTTGALISGDENEVFMSQENPPLELDDLLRVEEKPPLSQNTGSQGSQDSIKNPKLTVRERTQRWEALGGGLPSYFSTLPKSFRHKATDICYDDPAYAYYAPDSPTGEGQFCFEDEELAREVSRACTSSLGSPSGIPLPTSKLRPPRSSLPLGVSSSASRRSTAHDKSLSPGRDEGAKSVTSSVLSNESSLERRMGVVLQENGEVQGVAVKGRSSVTKGRGGSLLPTRSSGLQVGTVGRSGGACTLHPDGHVKIGGTRGH